MLIDRNIDAIYAGHDAGHYRLPPAVAAARDTIVGLMEARAAAYTARDAAEAATRHARSATAVELLDLATAGKPLPAEPGRPILEAKHEHERRAAGLQALSDAVAAAERRLRNVLRDETDAIVTEALQPAVAEVQAALLEAAAALEGVELGDTEAVMRTPDRVDAYQALLAATRRHEAIMATRLGLLRLSGTGRLPARAEVSNFIAPRRDLEGAARLLDLVRRGAELWCPTDEQLATAPARRMERVAVAARDEGPGQRGRGRALTGRREVATVEP